MQYDNLSYADTRQALKVFLKYYLLHTIFIFAVV